MGFSKILTAAVFLAAFVALTPLAFADAYKLSLGPGDGGITLSNGYIVEMNAISLNPKSATFEISESSGSNSPVSTVVDEVKLFPEQIYDNKEIGVLLYAAMPYINCGSTDLKDCYTMMVVASKQSIKRRPYMQEGDFVMLKGNEEDDNIYKVTLTGLKGSTTILDSAALTVPQATFQISLAGKVLKKVTLSPNKSFFYMDKGILINLKNVRLEGPAKKLTASAVIVRAFDYDWDASPDQPPQ